ncbi:MAG TPA: PhzF family phenazine biosynthesis protein [Candidatus Limnocylindria bacterium]|nr:PhzF family phenazine biosynthesis protein [Candidatus Limnocylindria bacterium]
MIRYRYHTLDVFTDRIFSGNPLAVFPHALGISGEHMQQIAGELNLSETVFVLPPEDREHTRRLRIFTPGAELPFAGHPTIGTAHLLVRLGEVPMHGGVARIVFGEGVGPVEVVVREGPPAFAQLTAAKLPERGPDPPPTAALARALSLVPADLLGGDRSPESYSCGVPFLFVPVRDRATLARARIDTAAWLAALGSYPAQEVFVFAADPERPGSDLRARMFAPALGIPEDPATGSAAAALAGYLGARSKERDGTLRQVIEQGFEMGRPSLILLEADVRDGAVVAVRVGGEAVLVSEGHMLVPATEPLIAQPVRSEV